MSEGDLGRKWPEYLRRNGSTYVNRYEPCYFCGKTGVEAVVEDESGVWIATHKNCLNDFLARMDEQKTEADDGTDR